MTATPTTPHHVFGTVYLDAELIIQSLGRKRSLILNDDGRLLLNLTDYNPGMSVEVKFADVKQLLRLCDRLHDLMHAHNLFEVEA